MRPKNTHTNQSPNRKTKPSITSKKTNEEIQIHIKKAYKKESTRKCLQMSNQSSSKNKNNGKKSVPFSIYVLYMAQRKKIKKIREGEEINGGNHHI